MLSRGFCPGGISRWGSEQPPDTPGSNERGGYEMVQTEVNTRTARNGRESGIPVPAHVIAPRRGLPSGRAVVGGFLVALAAVGIFAAYSGAQRRSRTFYVVAAHDVAPGTRLSAADLSLTAIDLPVATRRHPFRGAPDGEGSLGVGPIARGGPV